MISSIARRTFLTALGGAAASAILPIAARAQQPAMPVIGFLNSISSGDGVDLVSAFRDGLRESGFVEGQNVAIEYRWAEGHYDRLPTLATELVRARVAAIAATGGTVSGLAAKAATATIPIVFTTGDDPVKTGLVTNLNRPAGNITGVVTLANQLGAKRLELLHQVVPKAETIAVLLNPTSSSKAQLSDVQQAAAILGVKLNVLSASTERGIDQAFASLAQQRADALIVGVDPFFNGRRNQVIALAAKDAIPTIYFFRGFATAGGLMSYAPSLVDAYRQTGVYIGRVLKGMKPSELPVMQPTKFEFVINLKTAKALGLTVPQTLLVAADEVIE
ncbi:MAG: ABC transporter substrate-binding protein [Xanthobacteraceae bacterium]